MWRKIIKKELDKSKIKLKQEEISRSVNELESISWKLKEDNLILLDAIWRKELKQKVINKKTAELIELMEEAEQDYKTSKNKLDDLVLILKNTETKNKYKLDWIKELEKEYKNKDLELSTSFKKEEKSLNTKISKLKDVNFDLLLDKNNLISNNKSLKQENNDLTKQINKNIKQLQKQNEEIKWFDSKIEKLDDDYISKKIRKDIVNWEILDLEDSKDSLTIELQKITENYRILQEDIKESKKELTNTKELNLKLVKREEKLKDRETYIKQYYEKAWLTINL